MLGGCELEERAGLDGLAVLVRAGARGLGLPGERGRPAGTGADRPAVRVHLPPPDGAGRGRGHGSRLRARPLRREARPGPRVRADGAVPGRRSPRSSSPVPGWSYPLALLGTSLLGLGAGVSAGPLNAYPQVLFTSRSESAVVALHTVVGVGLAVTPVLAGAALDRGLVARRARPPRRGEPRAPPRRRAAGPARAGASPSAGPRAPDRWALLRSGSSSESPRCTESPSRSTATGRSSTSPRSAASAWRRRGSP